MRFVTRAAGRLTVLGLATVQGSLVGPTTWSLKGERHLRSPFAHHPTPRR
jgi:hypothetical protein